jgi:2-polyprenyl-3-methyl-5-hydroxy-6-metoxy-1,4-benzoquinol methylase
MALDTPNQRALHQARQSQLENSSRYVDCFLENLNLETDYNSAACPTCGLRPGKALFTKRQGLYSHCHYCQHIFLSNPLRSEKLLEFYAGYPTSSLEWHLNESEFYRRIYQRGLDLIKPHCQGRKLLDIGCSSGYFLSIASDQGFQSHGIEPNRKESAYATSNGIDIVGATIADLKTDECFDAITLWDVLEHIPAPIHYIKSLRTHLSRQGLVFIQVPSSDSLAARIMRSACNMFDGIEHLTLFSSRSLDLAFQKAGFSVIFKQSVISEVHAISNFMSYEVDPYLGSPEVPFTANFLTPEYIEESGLGYKIQAVYRVDH